MKTKYSKSGTIEYASEKEEECESGTLVPIEYASEKEVKKTREEGQGVYIRIVQH